MTNKIPDDYENPIDKLLCGLCDKMNPILYKYNFTPNIITTISFLFTLLSLYFLIKGEYLLAGISHIISYYFDCSDGKFARKYDMITTFGDYYDHITDILGIFLPILVIYLNKNISRRYFVTMIIITFIFMGLMTFHIKNTEKYYKQNARNDNEHSILEKITDNFVPKIDIDIQYTKYIGPGTFNVVFAILLYLTKFNIYK